MNVNSMTPIKNWLDRAQEKRRSRFNWSEAIGLPLGVAWVAGVMYLWLI